MFYSFFITLWLLWATHTEFIVPSLTTHYAGTINGKYQFQMNITADGNAVQGYYKYYSQKEGLYVTGTEDPASHQIKLDESANGKVTGHFEGSRNGPGKIAGIWYNADRTKQFPFEMSTTEFTQGFEYQVGYKKDNGSVTLNSITVMLKNASTVVQKIELGDSIITTGEKPEFYLEDMNFDGTPDLCIPGMSGSQNIPFLYFLFTNGVSFVLNEECSGISGAFVNLQTRRIDAEAASGCCWHENSSYAYVGNRYYKVVEEITEENKKTTRTWRVENGNRIEIKK